jgi:ribosomal protein S18 acetylase RimI-like enzyme
MTTCRRIRRAIPGCRNSPAKIRYNAFRWCFPPIFPRQVLRLTSFHSPARTHKRWSLSPRSRFPAFSAAGRAKWARTTAFAPPSGELIATGGERLQHDGYSEISAIWTHPSFRGQGFAVSLIWHLVRNHRRDGLVSWLHAGCANHRAVRLYLGMGFEQVRKVTLHRISRKTL